MILFEREHGWNLQVNQACAQQITAISHRVHLRQNMKVHAKCKNDPNQENSPRRNKNQINYIVLDPFQAVPCGNLGHITWDIEPMRVCQTDHYIEI